MTQPTMIERRKGLLLSKRLATPLSDLTAGEWFQLAIEAEQFMKDCGPFDSAYPFFVQQREDLMEAAAFVERFPGVTPR